MRIGVIVAMDKEFAQLQTLASDKKEQTVAGRTFVLGRIGENEIVMQKCGIGKVNAAVGTSEMIAAFHPDLVISTGVAGGADTSLEVCEVVVSTACCYHDVYCGDECAMGQVLGMPERFESTPLSLRRPHRSTATRRFTPDSSSPATGLSTLARRCSRFSTTSQRQWL